MTKIQETMTKAKEIVVKINDEHPGIWGRALIAGIAGAIGCSIGMLLGVDRGNAWGYKRGLADGVLVGLLKAMKGDLT